MSECDGEQAARSVALEQAYVHEVYEQCAEKTAQSRQWPRIYKFLEELEPGALVCDIGNYIITVDSLIFIQLFFNLLPSFYNILFTMTYIDIYI